VERQKDRNLVVNSTRTRMRFITKLKILSNKFSGDRSTWRKPTIVKAKGVYFTLSLYFYLRSQQGFILYFHVHLLEEHT
jgi:hypothetical protein